jgi:5-methylcytosine-specific restriction endonuclease McrA
VSNSDSTVLKFCKKCNCETEREKSGRCKPCKRAYLYQWRKDNPEKLRALINKWDSKNAERIKVAAHERYMRPRDEKLAEAKAYYEKNKEKLKPKKAEWQKRNLEKCRISDQNRRAKKAKSGGALSVGLKDKLFTLQRGKCACCGLPLGSNYHLDHIMPLALGGSNTDDNIQLLRQRCNNQKHAKHPVDFMQSRGFLL